MDRLAFAVTSDHTVASQCTVLNLRDVLYANNVAIAAHHDRADVGERSDRTFGTDQQRFATLDQTASAIIAIVALQCAF